jgi:hypothetical protein
LLRYTIWKVDCQGYDEVIEGSEKMVFVWLLIAALLIGGTGCAEGPAGVQGSAGNRDVFIADRVVQVYLVMKPEIWKNLQSRAMKEEYKQTDFWFDGELVSGVAVRTKGSSSLTYVVDDESNRLSLKVDFNLLNNALTFRGLKKLNFHNNYRDPALMREVLAYELFAQMGVPAPRATHVDLWVNDTHRGATSAGMMAISISLFLPDPIWTGPKKTWKSSGLK